MDHLFDNKSEYVDCECNFDHVSRVFLISRSDKKTKTKTTTTKNLTGKGRRKINVFLVMFI